jgi:hypothetical protein
MKLFLLLITIISSNLSLASGLTLKDLVGNYKITSENPIAVLGGGVTLEYQVEIKSEETIELVKLIRQTFEGEDSVELSKLNCSGAIALSTEQVLVSKINCKDEFGFTQKINLSNVEDINAENIKVNVDSSLYGKKIKMNFQKIM